MRLLVLLLLGFLAGCAEAPLEEYHGADAYSAALPQTIQLKGCTGGRSTAFLPGPLVSPTVPPGWEAERDIAGVYLEFLSCEHILLADFERGPIRFVLEFHAEMEIPSKCIPGDYTLYGALERAWSDDAEIAAYLQSKLGMPAEHASIRVERDGTGDPGVVRWVWAGEGQQESSVRFIRIGGPTNEGTSVQRLAWQAGDGLTMLDIRLGGLQTRYEPRVTPGKLFAPTLYSQTGLTDYFGDGGDVDRAEPVGQFHYFADHRCDRPVAA